MISGVVTIQLIFVLSSGFRGVMCLTGCDSLLATVLGHIYSTSHNVKRLNWNDDTNCRPSPTSASAQDED